MSHLMTSGAPCALADGHRPPHRSSAGMARRRAYWNHYNHTVAGILRNVRMDAQRRGTR